MDASRIFSNGQGATGMFGLEIPLHNRHPTPKPAGAGNGTATPQMVAFSADTHPQTQLSMRQGYPHASQPSAASDDDDEPEGSANDGGVSDPKRKASQWHRMKWTDTMVKLLIMAVYYIGDEAGGAPTTTSPDGQEGRKNSKPASSTAAGLQQKKGKWKSVSRAMMEKGYCVSPQQCEDKFNDLNKRYKRVNDILGRGTACRVVENQSLLESMDLSPKLKEEARKLLNSKHLFFREMCAYHNSCASAAHPHHHSPESAMEKQNSHLNHRNSAGPGQIGHQLHDHGEEEEGEEDVEVEEEEYSEEDWEEEEETGEARKKARVQEIKGEVIGVMGDGSKTTSEKRMWLMGRMVELEEAGVKYQMEALEMEKQRWKWARYCRKKEVEMERKKLENERQRLENQRMMLLLRQKELEFV